MSKFTKYQRPPYQKPPIPHPIWRGIGCLLIIITPIMSYALGRILLDYGLLHGWPIPRELLGRVRLPDWAWRMNILEDIARWIYSLDHLLALIAFFIVILILLTGIVSTIYSMVYRFIGPPRYSAIDAPPPSRKARLYKR